VLVFGMGQQCPRRSPAWWFGPLSLLLLAVSHRQSSQCCCMTMPPFDDFDHLLQARPAPHCCSNNVMASA
jgi:hypothetical protein